jgi:hypothetical protein
MRRLRLVMMAVLIVSILSAVAVASASAATQLSYTGNGTFTISSGENTLETVGGIQLTCTSDKGNGQLAASPAKTALLTILFSGCKSAGKTCTSQGQPSGSIQTKTLEATFVLVTATQGGIYLTPDPATGKQLLLETKCGTSVIEWEGALIGDFTENGKTQLTAGFTQTAGKQTIKKAKNGETEEVSGSIAVNLGKGSEEAGLELEETFKVESGTVMLTL